MLWVCPVLGQQVASLCSDWCTCLRVVLRGDRGGGRVTSGAAGPCRESLAQVPLRLLRDIYKAGVSGAHADKALSGRRARCGVGW